MNVTQIYTGCLAQGAYFISSNGEAAIIDPLRETQPYIQRLAKDGVKLKYIFETHFHADFVSGHLDLARQTGATIIFGPLAQPTYDALVATDGQIFPLGDIKLQVIHTPGHTMESSCFLLFDEKNIPTALFSGDTLFLGDVGRPDLAQKAANLTQEQLAGLLYDSLYQKILPLPDSITVYPAHGAGSACGKNMMKETIDTLGHQKLSNYALKQPNKESFIKAVTDGLLPPPAYFGMNVAMNKNGYASFDSVMAQGLRAIPVEELEAIVSSTGALVLDTRAAAIFAKGFIPKSINIGLGGDFAPWVGALVADVRQPLVLLTEVGQEEEAITRLGRVGFDHILGYLKGGFEAWLGLGKETDSIERLPAADFSEMYQSAPGPIVDVRKESEFEAEHLPRASNLPLAYINQWMDSLDPVRPFYLHCAGGYRSMMAASILMARGYRNFHEIEGGFNALKAVSVQS